MYYLISPAASVEGVVKEFASKEDVIEHLKFYYFYEQLEIIPKMDNNLQLIISG